MNLVILERYIDIWMLVGAICVVYGVVSMFTFNSEEYDAKYSQQVTPIMSMLTFKILVTLVVLICTPIAPLFLGLDVYKYIKNKIHKG